jgi:ABC-type lipoprotein export system ATPase subunit
MRRLLLQARSISRQSTGAVALRDVSLAVAEGDLTAILGPPGAGKSTLLRVLGFAEAPDAGDLFWLGRLVTGLTPGAFGGRVVWLPAPGLAAIGAALAQPPDLLLVDEPPDGAAMRLLAGGARTTVVVATANAELAAWCRTIYLLEQGRLRPLV